ncbi:MAG: hypothetical protein KJ822_16660 [Proteobacteria bacterium]|nr:hypothetical protein [Pseudomonadota bacterium]MBU4356948.1 hypothetical protein [Pseudomonadota bacterium]
MMKEMFRAPRQFKVMLGGGKGNQVQECGRRLRFHERHRTGLGGGPIWVI